VLTAVVVVMAVVLLGLLVWSALKWNKGGDEPYGDGHDGRRFRMGRIDSPCRSEFSYSTEATTENEFVMASRLRHDRTSTTSTDRICLVFRFILYALKLETVCLCTYAVIVLFLCSISSFHENADIRNLGRPVPIFHRTDLLEIRAEHFCGKVPTLCSIQPAVHPGHSIKRFRRDETLASPQFLPPGLYRRRRLSSPPLPQLALAAAASTPTPPLRAQPRRRSTTSPPPRAPTWRPHAASSSTHPRSTRTAAGREIRPDGRRPRDPPGRPPVSRRVEGRWRRAQPRRGCRRRRAPRSDLGQIC
jgi:hypothetical protein